ncbi:MAG: hypothetical protein ACSLEX_02965 [Minisyncoccota bacterium]
MTSSIPTHRKFPVSLALRRTIALQLPEHEQEIPLNTLLNIMYKTFAQKTIREQRGVIKFIRHLYLLSMMKRHIHLEESTYQEQTARSLLAMLCQHLRHSNPTARRQIIKQARLMNSTVFIETAIMEATFESPLSSPKPLYYDGRGHGRYNAQCITR